MSVSSANILIRCPHCQNILGEFLPGGQVLQRFRDRHTIGLITFVRCERCARVGRTSTWVHPNVAEVAARMLGLPVVTLEPNVAAQAVTLESAAV